MQHNEPVTVEDVLSDIRTELEKLNKNFVNLVKILAQIRNCFE